MKIGDKFSKSIKVTAGDLIPIKFDTPESFFQKLVAEKSLWSDLQQKARMNDDHAANYAWQTIVSQIDQLIARFQQMANADTDEQNYRSLIEEYGRRKFLPPGSAPFDFITKFAVTDPAQAMRTAISIYEVPLQFSQTQWGSKWARAGALAELLMRNWSKNFEGLDTNLKEFSETWDKRFEGVRKALEETLAYSSVSSQGFSDLLKNEAERADEASKQQKAFIEELTERHKAEIEAAITDGKAQVDAIKKTYNAELALQAPTTYWADKRKAHWWLSLAWAVAFAVFAGLLALCVWAVWHATAETAFSTYLEMARQSSKPPTDVPYGVLLPTVGAGFLAVWILRIISRQLLLNLALASDAGERVSMVKTFLALMQLPDHVKEPDRILILSALFRPAARSDDDGAPPNWFDLVMQRLK